MFKSIHKLVFFIYIVFISVNFIKAEDNITLSYIPFNSVSIGDGFDAYKEKIKNSPLKETSVKEIQKEKVIYKIKFIPDIVSLSKEIGVFDNPSSVFIDSLKTKFLSDAKVNDYTLSYLISVKVTNSLSVLRDPPQLNEEALKILSKKESNLQKIKTFTENFGNYFLKGVEKGGEFISLIKIVPNSKWDYKNIKEQFEYIGLKWENRKKILKELKKLAKNHEIVTKTISVANIRILPMDNTEDIFKTAEEFPEKIKEYPTAISYVFSPYTVFKEYEKIKPKKEQTGKYLIKARNSYMDRISLANNLLFIIKNDKQFRFDFLKKKEQMINYKKIADKSLNDSLLIKLNFSRYAKGEIKAEELLKTIPPLKKYTADLTIPLRYKASIPKEKLKVAEKKLFAFKRKEAVNDESHKSVKAPWIELNTLFHIEKKGKIIFLTSAMKAKKDEKTSFYRKNHEIVFDTYIDFPGLRFKEIENKKGSLFTNTITEKLNWKKFKGKGVLKSAFCGYDIEGEEDKANMGCVKILFNDLKVSFVHEEDFLKEPVIYERADKRFSLINKKGD